MEREEFEEKDLSDVIEPDLQEGNVEKASETILNLEEDKIEEKIQNEDDEKKEIHENTEFKNEEKRILIEITNIDKKIDNLNKLFLRKIQSVEFEKETTDKLHKELQVYKNDMYFQFVKPFIMDLINIRESMRKGLKNFSEKTEEEKLKFFESYIEEIQIILENNDIEIYQTDKEENRNVDMKKQKIMKKIVTSDETLHGKIYNISSNGYMYKEKVISPEKVEVYVYKKLEEEKGE